MNPNWYDEVLIAANNCRNLLNYAILTVDRQGQVIHASEQTSKLFGVSFACLQGRKITDILPDTKILNVLTQGDPVICTEVGSQGERFVAHYFPRLENGDQVGALGFFVRHGSIAGAREEVAAYRLVNATYEAVLDDVAVGIIIVNLEGKVIFSNRVGLLRLNVENQSSILFHKLVEHYPELGIEDVLKTGIPDDLKVITLNGEDVVARITPLFHQEELLGAVVKFIPKEEVGTSELVEQLHLLTSRLYQCKRELKFTVSDLSPFWTVIGESSNMKKLKRLAERVSKGDATVLLTGESGTGKGVFAKAIHRSSPRAAQPFVQINCAAIPENLLESELFGYEEGAFTGAVKGGRIGKLEMANRGTLFLDEIGDMPLVMQAKILRVLQEHSFEHLGGCKTIHVDVRVIAATNKDLQVLIKEGEFRLDLYYRLSVINIHLPPLRERDKDVLMLANRTIERLNSKYGLEVDGLALEVKRLFLDHSWPGNIRQMENVLEYAFNILEEGQMLLTSEDLPDDFCAPGKGTSTVGMENAVVTAENEAIVRALRQAGGNKKEAALLLGIPRSSLYAKIKKNGLRKE